MMMNEDIVGSPDHKKDTAKTDGDHPETESSSVTGSVTCREQLVRRRFQKLTFLASWLKQEV